MKELGFDIRQVLPWFPHEQEAPYVLVRVSDEYARAWVDVLGVPVRRCYVTDALLQTRSKKLGKPKSEILAGKLPDPGSTMAGDFGEILVYLYQAAKAHPQVALGPKKWRLKQDRKKPAPHSDVIHFVLPSWPRASNRDLLLCSEAKMKSTSGAKSPIKDAIKGCTTDRTSRLARTLEWLKERALSEDLGDVKIEHLDRFLHATDHPPATKRFRAVAVVCASLVDGELRNAPAETPTDYTVVVIVVPDLHRTYNEVFEATRRSVVPPAPPARATRSR